MGTNEVVDPRNLRLDGGNRMRQGRESIASCRLDQPKHESSAFGAAHLLAHLFLEQEPLDVTSLGISRCTWVRKGMRHTRMLLSQKWDASPRLGTTPSW